MTFKITEKQTEAAKLMASNASDIMLFGGSRSGKTFYIVRAIVIRAARIKSRHCILRKNFNHAKRSIWLDTLPKVMSICFPDLKAEWNKTDYFLKLPNGSEIWIGGLDDKERVEKILGNEYSTLFFNEVSQVDFSSVLIAKTRLAQKNELKKKTYYDMNPPPKSHWSYKVFIKKLNPEDNVPLKNKDKYVSLLMNPQDNIENIDSEYLELLESMPEEKKNRFLLGIFSDDSEGQAYYSFNSDKHIKETKPMFGTVFIGMDFNVNPMTATICQIIDGKIHIHDEVFLPDSDTFKMADELKKRGYRGTVIPDSTGKNRKTSGKSDFQILKDAGFYIQSTRNPYVRDRVNNVNRLFTNDLIVVNPKCVKLINDLESVKWKNGDLDEGTEKQLTHISDALGYVAWQLFPMNEMLGKIEITRM